MTSARNDRRKKALALAQEVWEKTKHDSKAEGRAFQAWLKLCKTNKEYVEIYRATIYHYPCRLAIVFHLVATLKSLSRIVRLCKMLNPSPKKTVC